MTNTFDMEDCYTNMERVGTIFYKELKHCLQKRIKTLRYFFPFVPNIIAKLEIGA